MLCDRPHARHHPQACHDRGVSFTAPTLLARQLATLDQLPAPVRSRHHRRQRVELRQDGNTLDDKDDLCADQRILISRAEWIEAKAVRLRWPHYKVEKGFSQA
jgi:alkanesulfonate monooxygenase